MSDLSPYNGLMPKLYKPTKLNLNQDLFCKIFALDPNCMGNQTQAYFHAYKTKSIESAKIGAMMLMKKPEIMARINEYLSIEGFNDQNVDKQHLFIINQHKDLPTKMKAISEYNKLKKRVTDRLEISIPKPIIDIDDDDANIKKIEEKKAKDVQYEESMVKYDE